MRIGTSTSLISTGVFLRNELLAPDPSVPSPSAEPPAPPTTGSIEAISSRPVRLSVVFTFMIAPPPEGPAGRRSGRAFWKAPMMTPCSRVQVMLRMPTAAGNLGLRIVPSGTMQRAGRVMPPFSGIVGSSV